MSAIPKAAAADERDEHYDAGNAKHVAQAQRGANEKAALFRSGLRHIMSNEGGRAYVYDLLEKSGVWRNSFTGNSETFFREGQRNVGLMLMADLQRDHGDAYLLMCREAVSRGARGYTPKQVKDKDSSKDEGDQ